MPREGYSPAKALKAAQKESAPKPRGTRGQANKTGATCGAKKRHGGGKCTLAAGWGTLHPGTGACKFHGGSLPNHNKAAIVQEANKLMGMPLEINPYDALIWCVRIAAGEVKWLTERMDELQQKDWLEDTLFGKQFHLYYRERKGRMDMLARYSQIAISLGIAERSVRLAEMHGEMIARLVKGIEQDLVDQLQLTAAQMEIWNTIWPQTVRRQLILIEGGGQELPAAEQKQLPRADAA